METLITNDIRVSVESHYSPDYSNPAAAKYIFVYRIIIENLGHETVQLLKRHWLIFDAGGSRRQVDGEGVIGQQPILHPGEQHQYTSWCPLAAPIGYMSGHYEFKDTIQERTFSVRIPKFNLIAPQVLN